MATYEGEGERLKQIVKEMQEPNGIDNQLQINKADFIHSNVGNFRDMYSIGAMLGQGAFGEVRKCVQRTTKVARAVKIIRRDAMSKEEEESFKYEIGILKKLDHPNILKLYEVF